MQAGRRRPRRAGLRECGRLPGKASFRLPDGTGPGMQTAFGSFSGSPPHLLRAKGIFKRQKMCYNIIGNAARKAAAADTAMHAAAAAPNIPHAENSGPLLRQPSNAARNGGFVMRLDKFVAQAAQQSRSDVRTAIRRGAVCVNGAVCRAPEVQVADTDAVTLKGMPLRAEKFIYIMLDKPKGVVSASADKNDVTVVDLVRGSWPRRSLFPAGRLDKSSTGFVLITDDGAFAHGLLAPKRHVPKTYEVLLDTPLTPEMIAGFAAGVHLADGSVMQPAALDPGANGPCSARVILRQGVYHQIKRMFGVYGAGVNELRRTAIGGMHLDEALGPGGFRALSPEEVARILQMDETGRQPLQ